MWIVSLRGQTYSSRAHSSWEVTLAFQDTSSNTDQNFSGFAPYTLVFQLPQNMQINPAFFLSRPWPGLLPCPDRKSVYLSVVIHLSRSQQPRKYPSTPLWLITSYFNAPTPSGLLPVGTDVTNYTYLHICTYICVQGWKILEDKRRRLFQLCISYPYSRY